MRDPADHQPENAVVLAPNVWVEPSNLQIHFVRGGGPGGQAVNKQATKAELRLAIRDIVGLDSQGLNRLRRLAGQRLTKNDELVIHSEAHRSQRDNRRDCIQRLQALVHQAATRPKKRKPTRKPRSAIEKRLREKRKTSEKKQQRRDKDMGPGDLDA